MSCNRRTRQINFSIFKKIFDIFFIWYGWCNIYGNIISRIRIAWLFCIAEINFCSVAQLKVSFYNVFVLKSLGYVENYASFAFNFSNIFVLIILRNIASYKFRASIRYSEFCIGAPNGDLIQQSDRFAFINRYLIARRKRIIAFFNTIWKRITLCNDIFFNVSDRCWSVAMNSEHGSRWCDPSFFVVIFQCQRKRIYRRNNRVTVPFYIGVVFRSKSFLINGQCISVAIRITRDLIWIRSGITIFYSTKLIIDSLLFTMAWLSIITSYLNSTSDFTQLIISWNIWCYFNCNGLIIARWFRWI